jgi:hypothetical protein
MSIDFAEASSIVANYAASNGAVAFSDEVVEHLNFWFFPVGYVGSRGVIVDRADGKLSAIGSSPSISLDDCFWGHERGFSASLSCLTVTAIYNSSQTVDFLFNVLIEGPQGRDPWPRREWLQHRLSQLPCTFGPQSFWLRIPWFRKTENEPIFEWSLTPVDSCPPDTDTKT